ncbi:MAG: hypothetical protein GOVbin3171_22 [Prokaryotic dsDNA virus sp.]|nr:MAG: hypothetical protein GOVbin3171_22 [Prokaryotic dsDNA virus sp.]
MKEINEEISICLRNGIKVYPIVYDKNHMKVEVDYNGRKKQSSEIYNWKTEQKQMQIKIIEIYEEIAKRIQNRG